MKPHAIAHRIAAEVVKTFPDHTMVRELWAELIDLVGQDEASRLLRNAVVELPPPTIN